MKRLATCLLALTVTACGSDSMSPAAQFTGRWTGRYPGPGTQFDIVYVSSQSGSTVSGTGFTTVSGLTRTFDFTGSTTPSTVTLVLASSGDTSNYSGSYVGSDSVAGFLTVGAEAIPLDLKKQ